MNIRKKYTPEEKQQAVHAALQGGESIAKIARRLGIGKSSISRWLNAAREAMGVISKSSHFVRYTIFRSLNIERA